MFRYIRRKRMGFELYKTPRKIDKEMMNILDNLGGASPKIYYNDTNIRRNRFEQRTIEIATYHERTKLSKTTEDMKNNIGLYPGIALMYHERSKSFGIAGFSLDDHGNMYHISRLQKRNSQGKRNRKNAQKDQLKEWYNNLQEDHRNPLGFDFKFDATPVTYSKKPYNRFQPAESSDKYKIGLILSKMIQP